jgi:hypothetical protein
VEDAELTEIALVRELLLSDPEVVAWLASHGEEIDDEETAAAA